MPRPTVPLVAAALLALGLAASPAWAQQKPPTQYINLGDVRRLAEACDDWAATLDQATTLLRSGAIDAATGDRIDQVRQQVEPICLRQESVAAGRNLLPVVQGTVAVSGMIP